MNILLTPASIGPVALRNRIVLPPMTTRSADEEGYVTEDTIAYYAARARGGVGLITVEMAAPVKAGRHRRRELGLHDDRFLPGLGRLVAAIHAGGAKASIQLGHAGGHTRPDICGETPVAPSAIPHPVYETTLATIIPRAMGASEIADTIAGFAAAARRAREAGFDAVEIHAAHGYLISQFHTPAENCRTDAYGGALENRARFGLEVLRAVKAAVPDAAVVYRISVEDFFAAGMPWREGKEIAVWAAAAGANYRWGLGRPFATLLGCGAGRWPGLRRLMASQRLRDWFYYRARTSRGDEFRALARPGQVLTVIGDARRAGKSKEAIASAFEAALGIQ